MGRRYVPPNVHVVSMHKYLAEGFLCEDIIDNMSGYGGTHIDEQLLDSQEANGFQHGMPSGPCCILDSNLFRRR